MGAAQAQRLFMRGRRRRCFVMLSANIAIDHLVVVACLLPAVRAVNYRSKRKTRRLYRPSRVVHESRSYGDSDGEAALPAAFSRVVYRRDGQFASVVPFVSSCSPMLFANGSAFDNAMQELRRHRTSARACIAGLVVMRHFFFGIQRRVLELRQRAPVLVKEASLTHTRFVQRRAGEGAGGGAARPPRKRA